MSMMQRDPDAYWEQTGLQMGRELAAEDVIAGRPMRAPEELLRAGVHPNYNRALLQGYRDAWTANNPLAVAMGGN